jgi:2,4-dienoyl-CoA reductase-like NADH-dependent reductase (Old Yellow Enzyme family)
VTPPSVFAPARLGPLALRNRVIKTATYEGMSPGGVPSDALLRHHRDLAAGGVAMTTVAYCAVSPDGRTFADQMHMHAGIVPPLRRLTDAVHAEGAAASLQLGHCGFFTRNRALGVRRPLAPSAVLNGYGIAAGLPFSAAMTEDDVARVTEEFGTAAALAVEAGFDAVELHLGHGYLLSQFLSPATNRRRDRFGGSLENRLRFPVAVVRRVRERIGHEHALLAKTNLRDGFRGGLEVDDAIGVAQRLEAEGVDAAVLSGGFTSRTPMYLLRGGRPLAGMIAVEESRLQKLALALLGPLLVKRYPFSETFLLAHARRVRAAVRMPLVLLGGVVSRAGMETAMREGFDFVAIGRALIHDPAFVRKVERGEIERSGCTACNECMVEMDRGGVRCVLVASHS